MQKVRCAIYSISVDFQPFGASQRYRPAVKRYRTAVERYRDAAERNARINAL